MPMRLGRALLERRFPQYLAVYIGVSWGLVQFFAFLEDRFLLSPHWTDLVMATLAFLLPSVVLVIYFHGRAGPDRWHPIEKVAIPANLVVAAGILFIAFGAKDLGAITTTVRMQDEEGKGIERVVVKDEFRKSLALFTPYADSTDANTAWLGSAVWQGLANDLYQDIFLNLYPWMVFRSRIREAGFSSDAAMPRALKRSMTAEMHIPYFVDGTVARVDGGYRLEVVLNDTDRGRVVADRTYEGDDLFSLIDSASVQLRRDLDIPSRHIQESPDVPVAEHTTASLEALRYDAMGVDAAMVHDDFAAARVALDSALALDPKYADAAFTLYQLCIAMGDVQGAIPALRVAMDNLYRLPERAHYRVKGEWYAVHQDFPKSYAVYEMWVQLYPQDMDAQAGAAQMRLLQNDKKGALRAYETILQLDPGRLELLPRIGALYETVGEVDAAQKAYERYLAAAPEDAIALTALAGLYHRTGQPDTALTLYERAQLLKPEDTSIALDIASLHGDLGRFDQAQAGYDAALEAARTPQQRATVLARMNVYYRSRGAMARALEYGERSLDAARAFAPPFALLQKHLLGLADHVRAGHADQALALLDSLTARLQPPLDAVAPIGRMAVYEAMDRTDDLEAAVAQGQAMLQRTGLRALEDVIVYFDGRAHEMRNDWQGAIAAYEKERESAPTRAGIPARLGRCYRELGQLDRAEELLRQTLKVEPANGRAHYELALVYERMGRRDDAIAHLRQALDTWAIADADFPWAQRARAKLSELNQT